jgi:YfdX protein
MREYPSGASDMPTTTAAVGAKDYPTARVILYSLTREIRSRTFNLPLATYPDALKEAARLLDEKENQEASNVLLTALNTLVVVDKVTPLPWFSRARQFERLRKTARRIRL